MPSDSVRDYCTLYVDNNQLVVGLFKRKVTERLRCEAIDVRDKTRVGVVFDVATLNEVLHGVEWAILSLL